MDPDPDPVPDVRIRPKRSGSDQKNPDPTGSGTLPTHTVHSRIVVTEQLSSKTKKCDEAVRVFSKFANVTPSHDVVAEQRYRYVIETKS
jgi:hypothetical protein